MTERVVVWPGEGQSLADLLAALIALADDPHEVRWEHRGGVVTVPEYVAARYVDQVSPADTDGPDDEPAEDKTAAAKPVKRAPGRPRKATAGKEEVN